MSLGKVIQLIVVVLGLSVILYSIAGMFLGPGVKDHSLEVIGKYSYQDIGRNEKYILSSDGEGLPKIVIDSRVDDYHVDGENIYVARRPVEYYKDGDVLKSRIKTVCEYWSIDTSTNTIKKIDQRLHLKCK